MNELTQTTENSLFNKYEKLFMDEWNKLNASKDSNYDIYIYERNEKLFCINLSKYDHYHAKYSFSYLQLSLYKLDFISDILINSLIQLEKEYHTNINK